MRAWLMSCGAALLASATSASAQSPVIDRVDTIGIYLGACVERRLQGDVFGSQREVTFSLSFRRDGSIFGDPRRTFSFPAADVPDQARFLLRIQHEIRACAPLPFSKALGEAIAGRPYRFRYIYKPRKDTPA
jgi:hypothetical protein